MPTFKSFAFVALLALTGVIDVASIRGPSGVKEERAPMLDRANKSFDAIFQFLDGVEMNNESIGRIERIELRMKDMGQVLTKMRSAMLEEDADADQWRAFDNVFNKYSSLTGVIADKLEESAAFAERFDEYGSKRLDALDNVNTSFDTVSQFLDNVEIRKEGINEIEAVARIMNEMGPLLEKINDEMSDGDANMSQWDGNRSALTRYHSLMKSINDKLVSSYEFINGLGDSSEEDDEEEEGEVDVDGLIESLRFVKKAMDEADGVEDLGEVEDVLDYVSNNLDGVNDEVKSKFEEVTKALTKKLNEKKSSFEAADSDSGAKRVAMLNKLNTLINNLSQFLDGVEMSEEIIEKIKKVAATMDKIGSLLTGMREQVFEGGGDQLRIYKSTLASFTSFIAAVSDKLEVSAAYAEAMNEADNESSKEEVKRFDKSFDIVDV
eukprot:CAMPEP_0172489750 /NCGR_PEP_ID=MMETSP1066-20121228/19950_1 /TAXON_ID=671091 /ORGANISM="Coscinodiscus wailesii, Strain CCMP2513" /LENGTH=436 /DNA_ID=CAMNT_0013257833 /DNA_START=59 /DNA_END=1369 /DNA_ORIENTATION=+